MYPQVVIERACHNIEHTERARGEPAFPSLGRLLNECRVARSVTQAQSSDWTVERYRACRDFEVWLEEKVEMGKSRDAILKEHPKEAAAYLAWKKQLRTGTLVCPGWCDVCEGVGTLLRTDEEGDRFARPCPACRGVE